MGAWWYHKRDACRRSLCAGCALMAHHRPAKGWREQLCRSFWGHVFRVVLLLAAASALMTSGCGTTEEAPRTAEKFAPTSEAAPGNYANILSRHGIRIAIPSQGEFVLVNIPSFELIALQRRHRLLALTIHWAAEVGAGET
jgi:hypothetical protein